MSDIGSGSLPVSPSKLCVDHNVSESEMKATKRRKITCSTSGDMSLKDDKAPADVVQDIGARVVEEQNTCPVEVAEPTNIHLHEQDAPDDQLPSCNDPPSVEVENQSPEVAGNVKISHESASQLRENRDLSSNNVRVGSGSRVIPESISSHNVLVSHQSASQLNSPSCVPLKHALENNTKQIEQLQKSHKDLVLQMKSDHEREMWELHNKYNLKHQEAEAKYRCTMSGLEKNRRKILMNRLLAECFSRQQGGVSSSSGIQHQGVQYRGQQPVLGHPITSGNVQALVINTCITPTTSNPRAGPHAAASSMRTPPLQTTARTHPPLANSASSSSHFTSSATVDYICISDDDDDRQ